MRALFLIALLALGGQARAQPALPGEWLGLELAPVWLQVNQTPDFNPASPARVAVGLAATARVFRMRWQSVYWTPAQAGLGVGVPEMSIFVHLSTEVGTRVPGLDGRIELGGALGAGLIMISYAGGCDGDCLVGGGPVVFSPVMRFALSDGPRLPVTLFTRAIIPLDRNEAPSSHNHGFGMPVLFGVDVGLGRL